MSPIQILFTLLFVSTTAFAQIEVPRSLTESDRRKVLEVLGPSTQVRLMGDPYPLGGYSGIDVGVSRDSIPGARLNGLGTTAENKSDIGLYSIALGKGLYYNVDAFLVFVPFSQQERISSFGGGARWLFYEMDSYPAYFSFQASANSTSFQNKVNLSNQSFDFLASAIQSDFTFYVGFGFVRSTAIFQGGAGGVTADGTTKVTALTKGRGLLGASYRWSKYYASVQVDRSSDENYAVKLGYRY